MCMCVCLCLCWNIEMLVSLFLSLFFEIKDKNIIFVCGNLLRYLLVSSVIYENLCFRPSFKMTIYCLAYTYRSVMDQCSGMWTKKKKQMLFFSTSRTEASIWEVSVVSDFNKRNDFHGFYSQTDGAGYTQKISFSFYITIQNETILDF